MTFSWARPLGAAITGVAVMVAVDLAIDTTFPVRLCVAFGVTYAVYAALYYGPEFLRRFRQSESGVALVEAAIVIPLSAMLLAGGFEVTRGISWYQATDHAVRDITRYLARVPAPPTTALAQDLILKNASIKAGLCIDTPPGCVKTLESVNVTVNAARSAAGFVSLDATVVVIAPLLKVIFPDPRVTLRVRHEQPYIGG